MDRVGRRAGMVRRAVQATVVAAAAVGVSTPTSVGAHTPHDVIAEVVTSPDFVDDSTVFAISQNRLLRSVDGGDTWKEIVNGVPGPILTRMAIAPSDASIAYLATLQQGRMLRSDDAGSSWREISPIPGADLVNQLAVSPSDPEVVVAAGADGGLYRSTDGGGRWDPLSGPGRVVSMAWSEPDGRLFVGDDGGSVLFSDDRGDTWQRAAGIAGEVSVIGAGSGPDAGVTLVGTSTGTILRSDDRGVSFTPLEGELPDEAVLGIASVDDGSGQPAIWVSSAVSGTRRSTDGGATFVLVDDGLSTDPQAAENDLPAFRGLTAADAADGRAALFLAGYDGAFRFDADADVWEPSETLADHVTGLAVSPDHASDATVVVNTYVKGIYLSTDGGTTFVESSTGLEQEVPGGNEALPVRRMHNVVFSPDFAADRTIFTATWTRFVISDDAGATWREVTVAPDPPDTSLRQFVIAVSPSYATDRTVLLGTRQGDIYRSDGGGEADTWEAISNVGARVRSLVPSPEFSATGEIYAATEAGVRHSLDGGVTWKATGPQGTAHLAVSPDYPTDGTVFAGTAGGVFVTRDGGGRWVPVAVATGTAVERVEAIAVSPEFGTDGTVLVSVAAAGMYRSTDGGVTFVPVGETLAEENLLVADFSNPTSAPIQFSPTYATDGTVYAYAQQAVVRSTDGGLSWERLELPAAVDFGTEPISSTTTTSSAVAADPDPPPEEESSTPWGLVVLAALAVVVAVVVVAVVVALRSGTGRRR